MRLKQYYDKELMKLQEEAQLFSLEYPEHAASLNLEKHKAVDPNVQRLLEGCAFLSAKIHQMVDEEADHLPEQLIQRLWPQLAEGFPSACMAIASPLAGFQKSMPIPKGSALQSKPVGDENTVCRFVTTSMLHVFPIHLSAVTHQQNENNSLRLTFTANGKLTWDQLDVDTLSLWVDTHPMKSQMIIHLLFCPHSQIKCYADGVEIPSCGLHFSFPAIEPQECLMPSLATVPQQLLFEAFIFPEKLQWVKIQGLNGLMLPDKIKSLSVEIINPNFLQGMTTIVREDFKLFAAPCVNLFEEDCEPILLDHKHHRYALFAQHAKPLSQQVHSVMNVSGIAQGHPAPILYKPLHSMMDPNQPYYVVKPQIRDSDYIQYYLSFNNPVLQKESISIRARVSNAHYPRRYLRPQSLSLVDRQYEPFITMTNVHQPHAYYSHESSKLSHYLLQQLRVQIEQINTDSQLKTLLSLLNRSKQPQIEKRIESIRTLEVYLRSMIRKGIVYPVQVMQIEINEIGFLSLSDCFQFGFLLHAFFQESAAIATVIQTTLICHPSEEKYTWLGNPKENYSL